MIHVGGSSYTNGIKFHATTYSVNFESYANSTKTFLRKNEEEKTSKILDFMRNIPLLRGIVSMIRNSKFMLFVLFLDTMQNVLLIKTNSKTESILFPLTICIYVAMLIFLIIIIWYIRSKIFKNLKSTWQYHGAEHKVIFINYEEIELTLKNCRKAPRVSDGCGTMFACLFIFVYFIINVITMLFGINLWLAFHFLIAQVVSYELFLLNRNFPVVCWLFKLGYWFQKHICTLEPSDFQLNQAIEAFKLLEKAETGQIPDEKLQELLQNGKQVSFLNKLF